MLWAQYCFLVKGSKRTKSLEQFKKQSKDAKGMIEKIVP